MLFGVRVQQQQQRQPVGWLYGFAQNVYTTILLLGASKAGQNIRQACNLMHRNNFPPRNCHNVQVITRRRSTLHSDYNLKRLYCFSHRILFTIKWQQCRKIKLERKLNYRCSNNTAVLCYGTIIKYKVCSVHYKGSGKRSFSLGQYSRKKDRHTFLRIRITHSIMLAPSQHQCHHMRNLDMHNRVYYQI